MNLLALQDFNLVARHGGFGKAALAAKRPKATLSRHVAELESSLGVRLFERSARQARLTDEGRALYERTAQLLTEVHDVATGIAAGDDRPRGLLRISAPMLFSQVAMGRLVAGFVARYPDVQVEVAAEDRTVDPVEEGYDLVIRVNPPPDQSLIGRCFLRDRLVVVAAPSIPRPATDQAYPAVLLRTMEVAPWRYLEGGAARTIYPAPVLRLATFIMVRDALREGAGTGLLPLSLALGDIARGTLVRWGDADGKEVELWALYTSRRLLSRKVSAFLDHLRDAFPEGTSGELAVLVQG